jgi:hypothetical protein
MPVDYKKAEKTLYFPKTKPSIIDVPAMTFIMVDGVGNPNTSEAYKTAVEILYGLSYSIKMSKKSGSAPDGYFDYVVPPLEGLWWLADSQVTDFSEKDKFCWTSMIRQPDFVTPDVFAEAKAALAKKKPELEVSATRLERFTEGLCVHVLHIGSYDDEPETIKALERFITESGYQNDISETRRHHELYLSDPRKVAPEKVKTVIRHPIRKP